MKLYDYQLQNKSEIYGAWNLGVRNVLSVLPTGAGKTVIFSAVMAEETGFSVAVAHRQEILGQIAMSLAKNEVAHSIIGPEKIVREFGKRQRKITGRSWIDPRSPVTVASVDTLIARRDKLREWGKTIGLWVFDEAHHLLEENKWGRATKLFPNARGLGVTATPLRTDRRSLGGVFDTLIVGPSQRKLIDSGYLCDYRIFAPESDINISKVKITGSGEFNQKQLAEAAQESHIVGDVVECYKKFANGEQGVTFVTDIVTAENTARAFQAAGVPAAALSHKSGDRFSALQAFKNGELLQLVNVDLFGEGFDLPSLGVVSMARHTASYGLYSQQFGRVLRTSPGKTHGKLIDHVGNVSRHGLPDRKIEWSLENGRSPREDIQGPPLRTCSGCYRVWESYSRTCPHCEFTPQLVERSLPEYVEGDLIELDPEVLARMRGDVKRIDLPAEIVANELHGAPEIVVAGFKAKHRNRQEAQAVLRREMALWGGGAKGIGLSDSERYKKFYREFGVDVLSAQALGKPDAVDLTERIDESLKQF